MNPNNIHDLNNYAVPINKQLIALYTVTYLQHYFRTFHKIAYLQYTSLSQC